MESKTILLLERSILYRHNRARLGRQEHV
jgi:hypothetical protein